MARRPVVPETALAAIRRFCEDKTPVEHRDQFRVECAVRGTSVTIFDCQAPWDPELGPDWIRMPIAQLRYAPDDQHWRLFWADRNDRWHPYDMIDPTLRLDRLLLEFDTDPTCIFWGLNPRSGR
jgi:hypothetical protein